MKNATRHNCKPRCSFCQVDIDVNTTISRFTRQRNDIKSARNVITQRAYSVDNRSWRKKKERS